MKYCLKFYSIMLLLCLVCRKPTRRRLSSCYRHGTAAFWAPVGNIKWHYKNKRLCKKTLPYIATKTSAMQTSMLFDCCFNLHYFDNEHFVNVCFKKCYISILYYCKLYSFNIEVWSCAVWDSSK